MPVSELETKIGDLLREELPGVDFGQSVTMAEDGLLDSLALTRIMSALVMEFDVVIPYEEIKRENFNSPKTMAELVSRCMEG